LGRQVGFESWVERDHLVALDFDASVINIVSQPFWLVWTPERGKPRRHAPDFLVRSAAGAVLVLDSRPLELIEDRDREAFEVTGRACGELGWRYAVWDRLEGPMAANQRWLAGYRHPRCMNAGIAEHLVGVFSRPTPPRRTSPRSPRAKMPRSFVTLGKSLMPSTSDCTTGSSALMRRV
jgi:hypothetical protein